MSALILPPGKPALLVIDLQNDFLHPDGKFASGLPGRSLPEIAQEKNLLGIANKVITAARAATVPIIHVKHAYRPDYADLPRNVRVFASMRERQGLQDGSWGADFLDAVKPAPPDFVVTKTRVSSFYATSLAGILRALGTTCLIVMGVVTNGAVEGRMKEFQSLTPNSHPPRSETQSSALIALRDSVTPTLSRQAGEGEKEAAAEGSLYDRHNSDTNSVSI